MPYYPLSQIKPNLFTNGGEYVLSTTKENYKGPYYEVSNGRRYTGGTPQDGPNILLIRPTQDISEGVMSGLGDSVQYIEYIFPNTEDNNLASQYNINSKPQPPRILPIPNPTLPTQKDIDLGVFSRYFCKKNNELKYFEIDEKTSSLLLSNSPTVAWDLYSTLSVLWYIKGGKEQVYKANKGLVSVAETQNKWYGFSQYFREDYLKYYVEP
jgi:hypothetical protein